MKALDRKLIVDLFRMKGQVLAIVLVIAAGVATFVMSLSTHASLERTLASYYDAYNFPDAFVRLKRAPSALAARFREIPGVATVETRVVVDVNLDVPTLSEPAVGRLVSLAERDSTGLNRVYLRRGRMLDPQRAGEALVSESFAEAHGLGPGDSVRAVVNGRYQRLQIVGVALSPEYIYQIRPGDILPDDKRFGVFWIHEAELAAAFDMTGAFNDACVTLAPDASQGEVIDRLDALTERYGGLGAFGRDDQPSHKFVANELKELRGMAIVVPTIFLGVASFLLNVVVSRLIGTQREQIAALKAFGYTRWEILRHYAKLVLLVAAIGFGLGTAVGAWLGQSVTVMYTRFFRFPEFAYHLGFETVAFCAGVTSFAAAMGTTLAVRRAARLQPAEAMRPEPPAHYRATIAERLGLDRWLSPTARMILRRIERTPVKSLLTVFGIALAGAVLILGNFVVDAIDYAIEAQFEIAQREDISITFVEPTSASAMHDVRNLPGVEACEPFRAVAVRMRFGSRSRRLAIQGIEADGQLHRLVDVHRRTVKVPDEGLVISEKLAEVLGVRVGESVTVEVLEGERPTRDLGVAAVIADFSGTAAYMRRDALQRFLREGPSVSGAFLAVDASEVDRLFTTLKQTPQVSAVTITGVALATFRRTIAENLLRMQSFTVGFAAIIAVGVVYNSARIALSERSRDFATLRVLGFTRREISHIFLGELALLTGCAIPLGLAMGYGLAALVIDLSYDTELFRIPLVVSRATYAFAASVTLGAVAASGLLVRRRLDRLDLVAVLKAPD